MHTYMQNSSMTSIIDSQVHDTVNSNDEFTLTKQSQICLMFNKETTIILKQNFYNKTNLRFVESFEVKYTVYSRTSVIKN